MTQNNLPVIGITGGVGSGKSVVMDILSEEFDAAVILADQVGHDLMQPGAVSYRQIISHFGREILGEDGQINRQALAAVVFSDEAKLKELNIPILAEDTGLNYGRTVIFDPETGEFKIKTAGKGDKVI